MSVNLVAAESDCYVDLDIVAIGGGGGGSYFKAGRGSGYVETSSVRMLNTRSPLEITVGQLDQSSKGSPTEFSVTSIWALPVRGGLNPCPDGLGHFFREEFSKFKWAFP